jgi:crotonobetainyl-CoA:carnitine CoA-transferase CaiB-like acyl-CoA transferase
MGVGSDRMFEELCAAIGRGDLAADARFAMNDGRVEHRDELHAELARTFTERDAQAWVDVCAELGIPSSVVNDLSQVAAQEQALAREMIVDTGVGGVRTAGIPVKLERTPGSIRLPPPALEG